jgi:hypothetical protein
MNTVFAVHPTKVVKGWMMDHTSFNNAIAIAAAV